MMSPMGEDGVLGRLQGDTHTHSWIILSQSSSHAARPTLLPPSLGQVLLPGSPRKGICPWRPPIKEQILYY
ncbi:hypothetical protein Nmel_003264, partial [Mimus melanotis]